MDNSHKFHTWIILLLVWNAALLLIVIAFGYFKLTAPQTTETVASECAQATLAALKDTCTSP